MIVRPARLSDAPGIATVHVAAWRSAYAGLLPSDYLASLSIVRHAAQHHANIAAGGDVLVAVAERHIVGFCTMGPPRRAGLGDAEIETLYVLDDWREHGLGRRLLQSAAESLAGRGARSLFLWVLDANPSRWFYERLGGRPVSRSTTRVAGRPFQQTAYAWDPIELLTSSAAKL